MDDYYDVFFAVKGSFLFLLFTLKGRIAYIQTHGVSYTHVCYFRLVAMSLIFKLLETCKACLLILFVRYAKIIFKYLFVNFEMNFLIFKV